MFLRYFSYIIYDCDEYDLFLYIRIMITEAGGNAADYYGNYAKIVDQIGPISHIPLSLDMVEKLEGIKLSPDVVSVLYLILDGSRS